MGSPMFGNPMFKGVTRPEPLDCETLPCPYLLGGSYSILYLGLKGSPVRLFEDLEGNKQFLKVAPSQTQLSPRAKAPHTANEQAALQSHVKPAPIRAAMKSLSIFCTARVASKEATASLLLRSPRTKVCAKVPFKP